jgi:cell division protein FtsA
MAGCEISSVYAGIAGGHITGFNSHGIIAVKGNEITQTDVDRVIEAARFITSWTPKFFRRAFPWMPR